MVRRLTGIILISVWYAIRGIVILSTGSYSAFIDFAITYGLWTRKNWGRLVSILYSIYYLLMYFLYTLSVLAVTPEAIFNIIINVLIIYYMTRKGVKAYFSTPSTN